MLFFTCWLGLSAAQLSGQAGEQTAVSQQVHGDLLCVHKQLWLLGLTS